MRILPVVAAAFILYSCASIGSPSGGRIDENPPRLLKINPPQGATEVSPEKVTFEFDELVNVKDAFSKVTVSPPTVSMPRVSSAGRKVDVTFFDTLVPNTTYTIDFGNSIEDINEGNKLPGLSYSFSTGKNLDTLRISGMVLGAEDLEPQQGILVGVHSDMADSAFIKKPFLRMTRTDDRGRFIIRGLAPGNYRVYALGDVNNDFRWDNPEELMAFYPYPVSPEAVSVNVTDTIYNMTTGLADTTRSRQSTRFLPDDILLSMFKPAFRPQYITSYQRPDSAIISIIFNAPNLQRPQITLIGDERSSSLKKRAIEEISRSNDSISLWLTDPDLFRKDSINLALKYIYEKSPENFVTRTDTLLFAMKRMPARKKNEKVPERFLNIGLIAGGSNHNVDQPVYLDFSEPVARLDINAIRFEQLTDTVWNSVKEFDGLKPDSVNPRRYIIDCPWKFDTSYRITVDSLAATSFTGLSNRELSATVKTRKESQYGLLDFRILGLPDSVPAFVQLLSTSDKPVKKVKVEGDKAIFRYLMPGEYYARIVEDTDGDGEYDPGNFHTGRQPETTSYFPKKIKIRANWEREYVWDLNAVNIDLQKPEAIKKNKPESENRNRNNEATEEEEDEYFDPTENPFDPNRKKRRRTTAGSY